MQYSAGCIIGFVVQELARLSDVVKNSCAGIFGFWLVLPFGFWLVLPYDIAINLILVSFYYYFYYYF
jgi:hypothetical protein